MNTSRGRGKAVSAEERHPEKAQRVKIEEKKVCLDLKELKGNFREGRMHRGLQTTVSRMNFI